MDKLITVPKKVEDLYGLYMELRKSQFRVKNVGADAKGTYVYLSKDEEKDPAPIVESWVGAPSPEPSLSVAKKRMSEMNELIEIEKKAEEIRKLESLKQAAVEAEDLSGPPVELKDEEGNPLGELMGENPKDSFVKRLWKKIF